MGLKGGDKGVKALLKDKCGGCFRRFDELSEMRDVIITGGKPGVEVVDVADGDGDQPIDLDKPKEPTKRDRTVVLMDGNVLMMSVPESVQTIGPFADVVYGYVRAQLRTGKLVVVAFDEPAHLTWAKREEQARRDAARRARQVTCSTDMQPCPLRDDFTVADLDALPDVHVLKAHRPCRVRLYDEVIRRVYRRVVGVMKQWETNGHDTGTLILDGVEVRGAERPVDSSRAVGMVGTDETVLADFQREAPIGEGDIKLIALENRVRELVSTKEGYEHYRLCITLTTDTDAFMTHLIDVSKRRVTPYTGALHSLFAMREPPTKRDREQLGSDAKATFLCVDVALLEGTVQKHMWSKASGVTPDPTAMLNAMLAFAGSAALCGCDFTLEGLKGSRFDHFWEVLPEFVANEPSALRVTNTALATDEAVAVQACNALYRVCVTASNYMENKPRYKRQAQTVSEVSDQLLRRSVWTTAYWAQNEFVATPAWGFAPAWG